MKKIKNPNIIIGSIIIILVIGMILFILKPRFETSSTYVTTNNNQPSTQQTFTFPANNPQFTAITDYIKMSTVSASLQKQSVSIYKISNKKNKLFQRDYFSDGFNGNQLVYTFSSDSPSFIQSGSLGTIGCIQESCELPWENFYKWDYEQQSFVLDNASHKDAFTSLLNQYQKIDKQGCEFIHNLIPESQAGLSLSELYKAYPSNVQYCSTTDKKLTAHIMFFLKSKKVLQEIISGDNIGSDEITKTQL